jgi:hypothetical protein
MAVVGGTGLRSGVPPQSVGRVLWRARLCAGTARPRRMNIFAIHHIALNYVPRYTKAVRDVAHVERSSADPRRGGRRRAWDDASIRKPVLIDQMVPSSPS